MNRVAITSLGILSALGMNLEENDKRLFSGESGIIPLEVSHPNNYKPMAGLVDLDKAISNLDVLTEKEKVNLTEFLLLNLFDDESFSKCSQKPWKESEKRNSPGYRTW